MALLNVKFCALVQNPAVNRAMNILHIELAFVFVPRDKQFTNILIKTNSCCY